MEETLPRAASVIVYCVHGHEASQNVAQALGGRYLEGGIEHWREEGGETAAKPMGAATRWVTRERPKIDRIACPWLIRRFVDRAAEFLYVPAPLVRKTAEEKTAVPYDVPDVEFSHDGELCSFDAFLKKFHLNDPALAELALIVVRRLAGLSILYKNDHEMLEHGMVVYDALYAWCKEGKDEVHTWNPAAYR